MVDVNPRKQGRYVAGTGHRIVPLTFLSAYRPDAVVIMNGVYREEVRAQLARPDLSPELMVA
jgi:C-methyltransferase C-terminal domain